MSISIDGPIKPGTLVVRKSAFDHVLDEDGPDPDEYGRVIHSFLNEQGDWDCYIAFFGEEIPEKHVKSPMPYVLRYYCSHLEIVDEPETGGGVIS